MSQTPIQTGAKVSNSRMMTSMVAIGIFCALTIVLTYQGTFERIKNNNEKAMQKAIFNVVPSADTSLIYVLDENNNLIAASKPSDGKKSVIVCFNDIDEFVGVAITAQGQGYADIIRIIYGYDPLKEAVIGFQVLESKETPGLGDKIEKDENFLANFYALDASLNDDKTGMKNKIIPVKPGTKKNNWEVDGITGATISSRAIANIISESCEYWLPIIHKNENEIKNK